jgi:hypothetical protein
MLSGDDEDEGERHGISGLVHNRLLFGTMRGRPEAVDQETAARGE